MPFEPNNKLSKGRPKGSSNKNSIAIKDAYKQLIENNLDKLQDDLDALDPKDRLKMIIDLSSYVIPKQRAVENKVELENKLINFDIRELYNRED